MALEGRTLEIDGLQFMHLRHTAAISLAEAHIDMPPTAAITGHSRRTCRQMLDTYGVKTGRLAGEAFKRRLAHEAGQGT